MNVCLSISLLSKLALRLSTVIPNSSAVCSSAFFKASEGLISSANALPRAVVLSAISFITSLPFFIASIYCSVAAFKALLSSDGAISFNLAITSLRVSFFAAL